jgi:hypothetical protein
VTRAGSTSEGGGPHASPHEPASPPLPLEVPLDETPLDDAPLDEPLLDPPLLDDTPLEDAPLEDAPPPSAPAPAESPLEHAEKTDGASAATNMATAIDRRRSGP